MHVGWFRSPFVVANLADAPIDHPLAALRSTALGAVERRARSFRLKRWHYTSVVTPRVLFACAVVDAGYVGNAFAYVVDRSNGRMYEWNALAPLARGVQIAPNSIDGSTTFEASGFGHITLDNDAQAGIRRVAVSLAAKGEKPALVASYEIADGAGAPEPIVVVEQVAEGRWLYTHKCYGLAASGTLSCGALSDAARSGEASAGLDWNCGYRLYETYWNWAAAAGTDERGRRVAFNLTAHRPWKERGTAVTDSHRADAADCAIWLDGRRTKLSRVEFDYDPDHILQPWRIRDADGLVDLTFVPDGQRQDDVNFGLIVSRFHQPYGRFTGRLRSPDGEAFELGDVYGVSEQHYARW